jgi:hypothetical protein
VPNFTHFKLVKIQRQFSQIDFQKLSYFKLVIFVVKTLKNYTKMWKANKQERQQNQERHQQVKEQKQQNQKRC